MAQCYFLIFYSKIWAICSRLYLILQSFIPDIVDNDWVEMFLNCSLKLLDLNAAIKILEEKSKSEATNFQKLHFASAMRTKMSYLIQMHYCPGCILWNNWHPGYLLVKRKYNNVRKLFSYITIMDIC